MTNTSTPKGSDTPQEPTTSEKVGALLGGLTPQESKERKNTITFHVAEHGLETSVDEVLSDKEFNARDNEDFEPNRNWYSVTVANEADKDHWVKLRNEYLACAWTSNQSMEEREENGNRMREIEIEMRELENKAR
jgi:hypothetical protein